MTNQDGQVYYGEENLGTTEQHYDNSAQVAASGAEATNEEWLPLGVYAIVKDGATETEKTLQLAVNKEGALRGNYHDLLSDQVTPLTGAVDRKIQRVAIQLTTNKDFVLETGLYNLTNDEAPALLHFGKDRQESRVLIRLKQPDEEQGK